MSTKICACCGQPFLPDPRVKNHTFCSAPACQKERRKQWRQNKMLTDPAYRENQSRIQRDWLDRNPDYWRAYRRKAPDQLALSTPNAPELDMPISGLYHIRFVPNTSSAKSDALIAEITPVCKDCPCKVNECKDST
jgi:hypothetical protein